MSLLNQLAPDFEALDQTGKTHHLNDYRGKWLLLYFYPKANTPGCTKEACSFRDNYADLKEKVSILGISHDSVETLKGFTQKYRLPFPLLSDPAQKIIRDYGAKGWFLTKRYSFLIDPQGKVARFYDWVWPSTHPQQVLKDLQELGA